GFKSTFQVPGDTGERRKRFTMTLGNGRAHVELESFGGTISLRRPGEPRPETERRRNRDKANLKLDLKELAHLDIDQTVREAMEEAMRELDREFPFVRTNPRPNPQSRPNPRPNPNPNPNPRIW